MVVFVITMQILLSAVVMAALVLTGILAPGSVIAWIFIVAVACTAIGVNLLVLSVTSEPLKKLISALAQAGGERTVLTPPNPNTPQYQRTGFKTILELIYKFGATPEEKPETSATKGSAVSSSMFEQALSQSKSGLIIFGKDRKIVYANEAAPVRKNPDGLQSLDLYFATDKSFETWLQECEEKAVHAEMLWQHIATLDDNSDERKTYDIAASYTKGSGTPVTMVLIEKTAQYAPEDKDLDFIAFAAHELRGPITVIRGYLDTLEDELSGALDDEQRELFDRLTVSANRLSSYISNILNASRYDRRHFHVHLTETTIAKVYSTIADDMAMRAKAQNRLLSVQIPPGLPTIAADAGSLSEVIGNLVDNAIKYSNEGGSIEVSAEATGSNMIQVSVKDHGIGMPPNVVANLFHKFYRSHRSRETVAGTGIGLYISKAIIESHGGEMNVTSVEGMGSTFSFTVPVYASVADKLHASGGDNADIIEHASSGGWIKNHGSIRG